MGLTRTVQSLLGYPEENCEGKSKPVKEISGEEGLRCVLPPATLLPEITLYDGGAASLELCTENLGFESCREGKMDEEEENKLREKRGRNMIRKKETRKREIPPPLTWLSGGENGGALRSSYMRAVKKDGRLILTEVRIERREFLHSTRDGGRLRMALVKEAEEEKSQNPREVVAPPGRRCHVAPPPPFLTAPRFVTTT